MKKVFLLGALLATLLFVSIPAYACLPTMPTDYPGGHIETPSPKPTGWFEGNIGNDTEGYSPMFYLGETSCGPIILFVKNEVLIGIIAISGIIAGVMTSQVMRRKRAKK